MIELRYLISSLFSQSGWALAVRENLAAVLDLV